MTAGPRDDAVLQVSDLVMDFRVGGRLVGAGDALRAVDGVSLTVSGLGDEADGSWFEVSLIPETLAATTLGRLEPGDRVNLETDVLARHVQRMLRLDAHHSLPSSVTEPIGGAR